MQPFLHSQETIWQGLLKEKAANLAAVAQFRIGLLLKKPLTNRAGAV